MHPSGDPLTAPDLPPGMTTHRVAFIVFDGVTMLDVSGPAEVLHQSGKLGHPYELVLVSPHGGTVTAANGLTLTGTVTAADAGPVDTVVVAGVISWPNTPLRKAC